MSFKNVEMTQRLELVQAKEKDGVNNVSIFVLFWYFYSENNWKELHDIRSQIRENMFDAVSLVLEQQVVINSCMAYRNDVRRKYTLFRYNQTKDQPKMTKKWYDVHDSHKA